jgi:hypothetical protein
MSNMFVAASVVFAGRMDSPHPPIMKRYCDTSASPSIRSLAVQNPSEQSYSMPNWRELGPSHGEFPLSGVSRGRAEQLARGLDPNIINLSVKRSSTYVCIVWLVPTFSPT